MKPRNNLGESQVELKFKQKQHIKEGRQLNQINITISQQLSHQPKKPQSSEQKVQQIASQARITKPRKRIFSFDKPQSLQQPQNVNPQNLPKIEQHKISINQIQPIVPHFINLSQNQLKQNQCNFCAQTLNQQMFNKAFNCQHVFCKLCLKTYFQTQIKNFKIITCPQQTCQKQLNQASLQFNNLTTDYKQKYQLVKFRNGIQKNDKLMLCPNQKCTKGFIQIDKDMKNGVCKVCQIQYCLTCKIKSHSGKCQSFQQILLKQKFKYKRCYGCKRVVQRNQGCPHMTCKCGAQFCYYCGSKWQVPHRCIRNLAGGQLVTDKLNKNLKCLRHEDYQFDSSIVGFLTKIPYYLVCFLFMTVYVAWSLAILVVMIAGILVGSFFSGYIALQCKFCKDGNSCAKIAFLLFIIFMPIGFIVGWIAIFIYGVANIFPKYLELALSAKLFPCFFFC